MHTGLEEKVGKDGLEEMAAFYAERAAGGVGLIVTGGVAPNREGWVLPMAGKLTTRAEAHEHNVVTRAVKEKGGKIAMQLLHAGRYAYHPWAVAPSKIKAPINVFRPRSLSAAEIAQTIGDFGRATELALEAGYEGVEIMGSEGYLINQFLAPRTNKRDDLYGCGFKGRSRFAIEAARAARQAAGRHNFALIFRLSLLELVEDGMSFDEAIELAMALRDEGVDIINTGIGWHEARVPTIATCVPRAAFTFASRKLRQVGLEVPVCATNRVNDVSVAESVLARGDADLISMARPLLADPYIVAKAFQGREAETNTCIACNQACLDHTFKLVPVSCLVNPRAGHETSLNLEPTEEPKRIAVVGAGMAGLSCATALAERGHQPTLFEASPEIGGQFKLAARIPGKEEFRETLRYFATRLELLPVDLRLSCPIDDVEQLSDFHAIVVATGVKPRTVDLPVLPGVIKPPRVRSYAQVLRAGAEPCGARVAVIGAGGIGFDVAHALTHDPTVSFYDEWGVDTTLSSRGALKAPLRSKPIRHVYLLQRKSTPHGVSLGKTTGWIHRAALKHRNVEMLSDCRYVGLTDNALRLQIKAETIDLPVDDVVLCAGQTSANALYDALRRANRPAFLIGGAQMAAELDAKRAIDQGFRLAANIDSATPGDIFEMPRGWKADALNFFVTNFPASKTRKAKQRHSI